MNHTLVNKSAKRKAHRKALRRMEEKATRKRILTIEKWLKDYYESRSDYPVSKKKLTWEQYRKQIKKQFGSGH